MSWQPDAQIAGSLLSSKSQTGRKLRLWIGLLLCCAIGPDATAKHPGALWDVVHGLCLPVKRLTRLPFPCTAVDRRGGYAVVKDLGPTGYLLVPTRRITGIEDPRLLVPDVPNYWRAAWDARRFVERKLGRVVPPDDLGMAINAKQGRSQNQLHIHVDCVRLNVRSALAALGYPPEVGWKPILLRGHSYFVRPVMEDALAAHDLFRLVAADGPSGPTDLGTQTMAVVGGASAAGAAPRLFVITAASSRENGGHAEELLDHACAAAR